MSSVKKNYLYNTLYQLLTFLLPLVTIPYLSRVLGAVGIGTYSYSFAISKYFVLFAMLGVNNYGNRTVAAIRGDRLALSKVFSEIYTMQCITSLITIVAYILFVLLFSPSAMSWIMLIYVVSSIFDINWMFFGLEEFKITVIRNTIIKLVSVACILVLVKEYSDLYLYGLIMALSFVVSQLAIWPFIKKHVDFHKVKMVDVLKHVKPNLVLFVPIIAVSLYKIMDKIMLGGMSDMTQVGYYENVESVISIPIALIQSLGTVMMPKMTNLLANDDADTGKKFFSNSIIFAFFLSSSLSFGIMAVCREFVPIFYGNGYEACINIFLTLAPSCLFIAIANVIRTQYLIPVRKDKIFIISVTLGAVTNIVFNLILIPYLQAIGAAIGTLFAEIVVCVYQIVMVRKDVELLKPFELSIPCIVAGIVMFGVIFNLRINISSLVLVLALKIVFGIVIYLFIATIGYVILKVFFNKNLLKELGYRK